MRRYTLVCKYFLLIICFFIINPSIVVAQTKTNIDVSPLEIYDQQMSYNESKTFEFNITNTSKNTDIKVKISAILENEYGDIIDNSDIVVLNKKEVVLKGNSAEKITLTINTPKKIMIGNYICYVEFEQADEDMVSKKQGNNIKVPIHIFIGNIEEYNNMLEEYKVVDNTITNGKKYTTLFNEIIENSFNLLNPFNTVSVLKNVVNEPLYIFRNSKGLILDYSDSLETYLINKIKNTGDIPVVINGKYKLLLNNSDVVESGVIKTETILQSQTSDIKTLVNKNKLPNGNYNIEGVLQSKNTTKNINISFSVSNQRIYIILSLCIFILIYYSLIFLIGRRIFKKIRNIK